VAEWGAGPLTFPQRLGPILGLPASPESVLLVIIKVHLVVKALIGFRAALREVRL
jgi:hypothetical protein